MKAKRIIAWICWGVPGLYLLLFLLPVAATPTPLGAVLTHLPLGWWAFLRRNLPQMTWNGNLIATGILCSAGVIVIGNWLLAALFKQIQQARHPEQTARPWRWRWTMGFYVAVWLLFAMAMGATGVFRHTTWLRADDQPWFQERVNASLEMREVAVDLRILQDDNPGIEATRKAFLHEPPVGRQLQKLLAEEFNVLFYAGQSNQVAAFIIIPRIPQLQAKGKFAVSLPGTGEFQERPLAELPQTIADMDAKYPPGK